MHEIAKTITGQVIDLLRDELDEAEKARKLSIDDAIEAEGAMISRYDTFKEEAQYLAAGQSKRTFELAETISANQALASKAQIDSEFVTVGTVVRIENIDTGNEKVFLILLGTVGGKRVFSEDLSEYCLVVSNASPIAKHLLGKTLGEDVVLPNDRSDWEIVEIH